MMMMKRLHTILSAILLSALTFSVMANEVYTAANEAYAAGNYADAALAYEQLLADNPAMCNSDRAEVLYNLGNAYFKQGELSHAILNYERSLRLNPTDADCRHNLRFAESRITDRIEDTHAFFLSTWARNLRNLLPEQTWMYCSIAMWLIVLLCVFGFLLGHAIALRKTSFFVGIFAALISIATCANAMSLHHRDSAREEAIITQGIVNAKSSPDRSGTDLFTLHEGTKVTISETIGDWCNITVGNNIGWIRLNTLERI